MELYGDVEIYLNSFLNPAFDMGDRPALVLSALSLGKYFSFFFSLSLSTGRFNVILFNTRLICLSRRKY